MALTYKEWREHFETREADDLEELNKALAIIGNDPAIKEHFGWTGIFNLRFEIEGALDSEK